jgi:hypothetical protein
VCASGEEEAHIFFLLECVCCVYRFIILRLEFRSCVLGLESVNS